MPTDLLGMGLLHTFKFVKNIISGKRDKVMCNRERCVCMLLSYPSWDAYIFLRRMLRRCRGCTWRGICIYITFLKSENFECTSEQRVSKKGFVGLSFNNKPTGTDIISGVGEWGRHRWGSRRVSYLWIPDGVVTCSPPAHQKP